MRRLTTTKLIPATVLLAALAWYSQPLFAQGRAANRRGTGVTLDPQTWMSLTAEQQLQRISSALPGDENTYYVVALQKMDGAKKKRGIVLCQGKGAAAAAIFSLFADSGARKRFVFRAFNNPVAAQLCYNWMLDYSCRCGYR
jgi:hypothetical protein